jgi:hypothetical protein
MPFKGNWRADSWLLGFMPQAATKPERYGIARVLGRSSSKSGDDNRLTVVCGLTPAAIARDGIVPIAASGDFKFAQREGNKRALALRRCQHSARSVRLEIETRMEVRSTDGQFPASSCGSTAWSDSFRAELPPLLVRREPIGSVSRPRECARARRPPEFPVFRWNAPR